MTQFLRPGQLLFALSLLMAGCAGPPRSDIRVSVADGPAAASAVSAYRARFGLSGVAIDPALSRLAAAQVRAMAERGLLSHEVSGNLRSRLVAIGVRNVPAAENVGRGHPTLARTLQAWRASPMHERNLKLAEATRLGFARADGPGGPWWALVIAGDPQPGAVWR